MVLLGINIDHVATLRNARGGVHPEPVRAAHLASEAGADRLVIHLREDRRHIRDEDARAICHAPPKPITLEMAATAEMLTIALELKPDRVCFVPEKREELTTEGGLDVVSHQATLASMIEPLQAKNIAVSLFTDPDTAQIEAASVLHANGVELHTGRFCDLEDSPAKAVELQRISAAAAMVAQAGMECHAGHGLSFDTVSEIAAIPQIQELNIGHFIIGEAVFSGLPAVIDQMRELIVKAR